jgi:hypothetical protein
LQSRDVLRAEPRKPPAGRFGTLSSHRFHERIGDASIMGGDESLAWWLLARLLRRDLDRLLSPSVGGRGTRGVGEAVRERNEGPDLEIRQSEGARRRVTCS